MSQSYLCCCFSCNFVLPFFLSCSLLISLHLYLLSFLFLYCPLSTLFLLILSFQYHLHLLPILGCWCSIIYCCNAPWEILGNWVGSWWWGTYFITCPPLPLMWCLCDHLLTWKKAKAFVPAPVIGQASAWLLFVFMSIFKALFYFVAWWKHFSHISFADLSFI